MVNDVWDQWEHIDHLFNVAEGWFPWISPGTWPDCDMIPLGRLSIRGERGPDRMSRLTKAEQYTLMTLFTIFRSPLFFGGDLPSNDPFTQSLLTNDEVLEMHAKGTEVRPVLYEADRIAITSVHSKTGDRYLALFNISDTLSLDVGVQLSDLGISGTAVARDLWSGTDLGTFDTSFSRPLSPHASVLVMLEETD